LSSEEIATINKDIYSSTLMPRQEKGTRESNALPYQLYADGTLSADRQSFVVQFAARNEVFGKKAAGSPFMVYTFNQTPPRAYAVKAGDTLKDTWSLEEFDQQHYHLAIHGPNGFLREFTGNSKDPQLIITCDYEVVKKSLTGNIVLKIKNQSTTPITLTVHDHAYGAKDIAKTVAAKSESTVTVNLSKSHNWYDFSVHTKGHEQFVTRYAGRVETGKSALTDPAIGK
jgi:phospholipase C